MAARSVKWRKASRSSSNGGDCVEVARLSEDQAGVRDSKNPGAGHLAIDRRAAKSFLDAVKTGRYDLP